MSFVLLLSWSTDGRDERRNWEKGLVENQSPLEAKSLRWNRYVCPKVWVVIVYKNCKAGWSRKHKGTIEPMASSWARRVAMGNMLTPKDLRGLVQRRDSKIEERRWVLPGSRRGCCGARGLCWCYRGWWQSLHLMGTCIGWFTRELKVTQDGCEWLLALTQFDYPGCVHRSGMHGDTSNVLIFFLYVLNLYLLCSKVDLILK